jgi:hypothetical protein
MDSVQAPLSVGIYPTLILMRAFDAPYVILHVTIGRVIAYAVLLIYTAGMEPSPLLLGHLLAYCTSPSLRMVIIVEQLVE